MTRWWPWPRPNRTPDPTPTEETPVTTDPTSPMAPGPGREFDPRDSSRCLLGRDCDTCSAFEVPLAVAIVSSGTATACVTLCEGCRAEGRLPPWFGVTEGIARSWAHAGHLGLRSDIVEGIATVRAGEPLRGLAGVPSGPFADPPGDLGWIAAGGYPDDHPDAPAPQDRTRNAAAWLRSIVAEAHVEAGTGDLAALDAVADLDPSVPQMIGGLILRASGNAVDGVDMEAVIRRTFDEGVKAAGRGPRADPFAAPIEPPPRSNGWIEIADYLDDQAEDAREQRRAARRNRAAQTPAPAEDTGDVR